MPVTWSIRYVTPGAGPTVTTRTCADWRIRHLSLNRKSAATDLLRFSITTASVDDASPFAEYGTLMLIRNDGSGDVNWFTGRCLKQPRRATAASHTLMYEIAGPWDWLETTTFQQMWATLDPAGTGGALINTARSRITLGQSLDGTKMHLGQVMTEVIYYAIYSAQSLPFPTTVDPTTHLPAPPDMTYGPFQIGTITPDITVPYAEVTDKSCAEIVKLLLRWVPDAIAWVDYSFAVPKLNIGQRGGLTAQTIAVKGGGPPLVSGWNPTPRYDLIPPCVIAKFEESNSVDGESFDRVTVDKYPPDVPDNANRALVMTVDLLGGQSTSTKQPIVVMERPTLAISSSAMAWLRRKEGWLNAKDVTGVLIYDVDNIACAALDTTFVDDDPNRITNVDGSANTTRDPDFPALDTLVSELINGQISDWMRETDSIYSAHVLIHFTASYVGGDPATKAQFDPVTNKREFWETINVTNAETQTYEQLTSSQAAEPVPTGLAQKIYQGLSQLHFEGSLEITEQSCSGLLPLGCSFNTTDGLAAWQTMQALILGVTENFDQGKTQIEFGPPIKLTLGDYVELLRAQRGRLPSYKLDQRTDGKAKGGAQVHGANVSPAHASIGPSVINLPQLPYSGYDASVGATPMIGVTPGMHQNKIGTIYGQLLTASPAPVLTVGAGAGTVYAQVDFTYDMASNAVTVTDVVLQSGDAPESTCGAGSGTLYQPLLSYTATVTAGRASVSVSPLVTGSQGFGVCLGAITGPWGI